MKLVLYDPAEINNWLTWVYFQPLLQFAIQERAEPIEKITSLDGLRNVGLLCHAEYLKPDVISRLKNDGCKIFSFDINDSSQLYQDSYGYGPEMELLDLIWKFSGIQKQNRSQSGMTLAPDFTISLKDEDFVTEENWLAYARMRDMGKIKSLPYLMWVNRPMAPKPFAERERKVLIRGGCHYYRVLLFFSLLRHGLLASESAFNVGDYYSPGMTDGYRYCDDCVRERAELGRTPYRRSEPDGRLARPSNCNSPAQWSMTELPAHWNNRCGRSFYWLADRFEEHYGPIDKAVVEAAFNGTYDDGKVFEKAISSSVFYADLKWPFSIFAPPRFWEAATSRTISFYPSRTNDQTYFPEIRDGEHYVTFKEDFSDLGQHMDITEDRYNEITENVHALYREWIEPTDYLTSTNLLRYILTTCEEATSGP